MVRFIVPEFVTAPGQVLAIVGSGPALGNWDAARAVRLSWREGHRWVANVQLEAGWHGALEFKVRNAPSHSNAGCPCSMPLAHVHMQH